MAYYAFLQVEALDSNYPELMAYSVYAFLQVEALDSNNPELNKMLNDCPWWSTPIWDKEENPMLFIWIKPRISERGYDRLRPFLQMLRDIRQYIVELAHEPDCPAPAEEFRNAVDDLGYQDLIPYFKEY
jgi:hypothetical protein